MRMHASTPTAEEASQPTDEWCLSHGYRIPRWLSKYGVWCPFKRGILFQGRYGTINCRCVGDGERVLSFHGLNASHSAFDELSGVLEDNKYTVVSFDLYGHGLSAIPRYDIFGSNYSLDFFVDQADEVLEHFGLHERPLSVIGISMGACLAAAFCDRHPERVERMILISPAGIIRRRPFMVKAIRLLHWLIPCIPYCVSRCCFSRKLPAGRMDNMTNHMMWRFFVTPKSISGILGIVKRLPMWNSSALYQRVGALCKPTLIMFGAKDTVTPPTSAPTFKSYFTNSHIIIFPDACHLVSYLMPSEIASTSLAFLGTPPDSNVSDYARWLPFSEDGSYIKEKERVILHHARESPLPPHTHTANTATNIAPGNQMYPIERMFSLPRPNGSAKRAFDASLVLVTLSDYEKSSQNESF
ncbi:putative alpha/beta hydrolase protein [Babesia divergens]|uniref:Alpha/beta hydrolase protein n=1 Tax=Babesia divergens TaxID=32595 RepID=A0AAD9LKC9_BABDI|nr:putative alpha/beta hydrolase protein [Babesia divergens]